MDAIKNGIVPPDYTWIIAYPMATQSLWAIDGIIRINQGIDALGPPLLG